MPNWSNWSGRLTATPADIVRVADEAEAVAAVRRANEAGQRVRVQGATHSHYPLVVTEGMLVDPSLMSGIESVDVGAREAVIRAGTRLADLGEPLREHGLALRNQGDIDRQAIAGAVSTGTHGTGPTLQNFSASVVGVRLVLASGEVVECDTSREAELFQASRLSLGSVGLVTSVRMALRDAYKLREELWLESLDEALDRIGELTSRTRHFEFFWMPGAERAACKALAVTDDEPEYPLAKEGKRCAFSYEVLANDRPDKHSEMEYSVPAARGPECMRAIRDLIHRDFEGLAWPVEYRTLAEDDVWLSTAYQRPTVTISVHQGIDAPDEPLFRACEEIFLAHEGRPHWGKVHYLDGDALRGMHERWSDWWSVRDRYDPDGRFLNERLAALAGR